MENNIASSENIIFSYTVEDGVKDGQFIHMDELAKEAGIKYKTVFSNNLYYSYITPQKKDAERGQDLEGRAWDVFTMFKYAIKAKTDSGDKRLSFEVIFVDNGKQATVTLVAVIQAYNDTGEPCLTFFLPEDD